MNHATFGNGIMLGNSKLVIFCLIFYFFFCFTVRLLNLISNLDIESLKILIITLIAPKLCKFLKQIFQVISNSSKGHCHQDRAI